MFIPPVGAGSGAGRGGCTGWMRGGCGWSYGEGSVGRGP
ncbi:hypothetical protein K530_50075 [Streptomyces noursei CCRC 11814]|nr:hypothetical protein K530_50075 [Streptomyces noursei CCRC 11814]